MKSANQILALLYDRREHYALPAELAKRANVSPQRLAKSLELLRQRGHVIESSPVQGLRLAQPIKLDAHLIERDLGAQRVGRNVICFDEVDSTNDVAFDAARPKRRNGDRHLAQTTGSESVPISAVPISADGLVVLAESQRAGRGRHGRRWTSPPGSGILMSVLLLDPQQRLSHEALTIAAGLAVAEGIDAACDTGCMLKWPNDVMLEGQKLAGILVEMKTLGGCTCIVVGVGINVSSSPPAARIGQPATCLSQYLGHDVERLELVRAVLRRLDQRIGGAQKLSGRSSVAADALDDIHRCWLARCEMINQRLSVAWGQARYEGRVLDVSPLQGLALQCDSGLVVHLPAAGASIEK